jgi:DNA-binding NtrC family response regulator
LRAEAAAGLTRCLFWRGRYPEAQTLLQSVDGAGDQASAHDLDIARVRVAVGLGDLGAAMHHASLACENATRHAAPHGIVGARAALAFAHLAAGDLHGVQRDVDSCLQAARAARDPLGALKARLLAAEAARRSGATAPARHLVAHVARVHLPATVRARLTLLADLAGPARAGIVERHIAGSGLRALALFAPSPLQDRVTSAFDAAIDVLQLCQSAADEGTVLVEICRRVRARLHAAAVGFFVTEGPTPVQIAGDGGRIEPAIAGRTLDARQPVPPSRVHDRIEGGTPIRFGGEPIGVLAARWTIANPPDVDRAQPIMTMAATAAASALAGAAARRRAAAAASLTDLVGISSAIADVRAAVERAAAAPFPILIEGESGSGKELVARALHRRSVRRDRTFSTLNCAALPDDLVDAELFGHRRGAFTGAVADRPGVFEEAHLGTLFLDEVGELSARAQAKLLRTLQEGEVRRVGENTARRVDVRLVAATNRDLRQEVAAARFRLDLLYRLDVVRIRVPPLRDRRDDIPVLAEHYWRAAADRVGSRAILTPPTIAALTAYDWPGNVRELQNVLASLAVRSPKRGVITPAALPPPFTSPAAHAELHLVDARRSFEQRFIRAALVRTGGHRGRAAEELGLSRQGLAKLMSRLRMRD